MFENAGPNECAIVALSAVLEKPVSEIQELADRVRMLEVIRARGTAPAETRRLIGFFGWDSTLLFTRDKHVPLQRLIEDLHYQGRTRAVFCVRDIGAAGTLHAVSIGPLGYVDLREQYILRRALDPDHELWQRTELPECKPNRKVIWYIVLHSNICG